MLEAEPAPVYQQIAAQAAKLHRLGLSNVQIARALGTTDKIVARAIAWRAADE